MERVVEHGFEDRQHSVGARFAPSLNVRLGSIDRSPAPLPSIVHGSAPSERIAVHELGDPSSYVSACEPIDLRLAESSFDALQASARIRFIFPAAVQIFL